MARYEVVPEGSRVWIEARSSLHPLSIEADGLQGWVELSFVDGVLDLSSPVDGRLRLDVDRLTSGRRVEDVELRRRLDARRHPTIEGVLAGIEPTETLHRYEVKGDLAFHGTTRSCMDEMWIEPVDEWLVRLDGWARFDVRDFGIRPPRLLFVRFDPEVQVRVELLAHRPHDDEPDPEEA